MMNKYHKEIFIAVLLGLTVLIPRAFSSIPHQDIAADYLADRGNLNEPMFGLAVPVDR